MKKIFKKHLFITGALVMLACVVMIAAIPNNIVQTFHLWVGSSTASVSSVTMGDGVGYFESNLEVDGIIYADGGITDTTGGVTATEIADITRTVQLDLNSAIIDTGGTITCMGSDTSTAPGVGAADGVPAITYAASTEMASIGWSFTVPADYSSGLSFRMMVSSSSDTSYASLGINWGIYVNNPNAIFDAASYGQTIVMNTNPSLSTSNSVLTFTPNATAAADFAAGDVVTVYFGNGDSRSSTAKTTEIKMVEARYTAVQ